MMPKPVAGLTRTVKDQKVPKDKLKRNQKRERPTVYERLLRKLQKAKKARTMNLKTSTPSPPKGFVSLREQFSLPAQVSVPAVIPISSSDSTLTSSGWEESLLSPVFPSAAKDISPAVGTGTALQNSPENSTLATLDTLISDAQLTLALITSISKEPPIEKEQSGVCLHCMPCYGMYDSDCPLHWTGTPKKEEESPPGRSIFSPTPATSLKPGQTMMRGPSTTLTEILRNPSTQSVLESPLNLESDSPSPLPTLRSRRGTSGFSLHPILGRHMPFRPPYPASKCIPSPPTPSSPTTVTLDNSSSIWMTTCPHCSASLQHRITISSKHLSTVELDTISVFGPSSKPE